MSHSATALQTREKGAVITFENYANESEITNLCTIIQESISEWSLSTQQKAKCVRIQKSATSDFAQQIKSHRLGNWTRNQG